MMRLSLFLLFSLSLFALPVHKPVPGGIVVLPVPSASLKDEVRFVNRRGVVFEERGRRYALAPVPLFVEPGVYTFKVLRNGKVFYKKLVKVGPAHYAEQHLVVKNRRKVDPNPADLRRIRAEAPRKKKAKAYHSEYMPDLAMAWPAKGPVSSTFGLRRFFNGQPRSPHRGLDIAASEGAPVRAAADGIVVDAGNFFFSGNLVFLEHGEGVMTLYAHLSKMAVEPGERVKKGQIVGFVGRTGRVTGPHLHFSVLVRGIYVDPALFLPPTGVP
ncbi:peptidoglycan DD-metalloendopeptidase family protein [Hydrogenimonas sp.]